MKHTYYSGITVLEIWGLSDTVRESVAGPQDVHPAPTNPTNPAPDINMDALDASIFAWLDVDVEWIWND